MIDYSWNQLKEKCPIKIDEIIRYALSIENTLKLRITDENLDKMKEKLINISSELEILLAKLIAILWNTDLIKSDIDKAIWSFLKDDITRYISLIDEKQNKLLEMHDGEALAGIARVTAFRKVLHVTLYGVIYHTIDLSSSEYKSYKPVANQDGTILQKDKNMFLRIFFLILSNNMSTLGGLPRKSSSGSVASFGRVVMPTTWKSLFTKAGEENVRNEYKERYGEDLKDEFDEFKELMDSGREVEVRDGDI